MDEEHCRKLIVNLPKNESSALVLFSGGQDSTTCLYWAKQNFRHVVALAFDYGQKHAVELEQAKRIADLAETPLELMDIRGTLGGSALTEHDLDVSADHALNAELPASFVPARNALFLTLAAGRAYVQGITDLVGGMCHTDYSGYPDCRREFVDATERSLSLALDSTITIHTPLMSLTKAETWKLAADLEIVSIIRDMTHTDYNGDRTTYNEWGYGKLDNPASILRAKGYKEAKANGWIPESPDE